MEFSWTERNQPHVIETRDRIGHVVPEYTSASRQAIVADGCDASAIPGCQDGDEDLEGVERKLSEVDLAQQQHASVITVVKP